MTESSTQAGTHSCLPSPGTVTRVLHSSRQHTFTSAGGAASAQLTGQGVLDTGPTWNGEHNLKSPSPQGDSLFTKKVSSQALHQVLLALLEHGGRLVAACSPRQCWPPPKPTKGSGNLARDFFPWNIPTFPSWVWDEAPGEGCAESVSPQHVPAARNTAPPFLNRVTHRLSLLR